jgi:hypothetical protein
MLSAVKHLRAHRKRLFAALRVTHSVLVVKIHHLCSLERILALAESLDYNEPAKMMWFLRYGLQRSAEALS